MEPSMGLLPVLIPLTLVGAFYVFITLKPF